MGDDWDTEVSTTNSNTAIVSVFVVILFVFVTEFSKKAMLLGIWWSC